MSLQCNFLSSSDLNCFFNYLILKTTIDGKDYFLDATEPYLSFGELPFRALNQYGRLMDLEDGSYWEDIEIKDYSTRLHTIQINSFEEKLKKDKPWIFND